MTPVKAFVDAIAEAIGADVAFLAEATPFVRVSLVAAAFTPTPNLLMGDLTLATRTGLEPLHAASAATQVGTDSATGEKIIQCRAPAGDWHWETTDDTEDAETIYGYALSDAAGANLIATALLDTPVLFHALTDGEQLDIDQVRFRMPVTPLY